jgi:hypothetical protein
VCRAGLYAEIAREVVGTHDGSPLVGKRASSCAAVPG